MTTYHLTRNLLTVTLLGIGACATPPESTANRKATPEQETRLTAFRQQEANASITVLPVRTGNTPRADVADVVGLILEQRGMTNLEASESAFHPPADRAFEQYDEPLGAFLKDHPIETDYAIYAEFVGSPGKGVDEVRAVVVDRTGQLVWMDRQTQDSRDFKRIKPGCPMTCCQLLTDRIAKQLDLPRAKEDRNPNGKFARKWADKSGTPDRRERKTMGDRVDAWKALRSGATVAVYPVRLSNTEVSTEAANRLAAMLTDDKLCTATDVEEPITIEIAPSSNEQKRLWDLAKAFRDRIRKNPPDADYALLADYAVDRGRGKAHAVHFVVCDRSGEWVIVDFQNDHHSDFQSVNPKNENDCSTLAARRLAAYLR